MLLKFCNINTIHFPAHIYFNMDSFEGIKKKIAAIFLSQVDFIVWFKRLMPLIDIISNVILALLGVLMVDWGE